MTNCEIFVIGDADAGHKKVGNRPIKEADTDFFQIHKFIHMHTNYRGHWYSCTKNYHLKSRYLMQSNNHFITS